MRKGFEGYLLSVSPQTRYCHEMSKKIAEIGYIPNPGVQASTFEDTDGIVGPSSARNDQKRPIAVLPGRPSENG